MKYKPLVPKNKIAEGWLSTSQLAMNFDLLKLFATGATHNEKTKLTRAQKELFASFNQEQQRLNRIEEVQYLKKYLVEQRTTINQIAAYLKKRDAAELKLYGRTTVFNTKEHYTGAPAGKFKLTNDLNDLRAKVNRLDELLRNARRKVSDCEMEDYRRKDELNDGGFMNRLVTFQKKLSKKKRLQKVA